MPAVLARITSASVTSRSIQRVPEGGRFFLHSLGLAVTFVPWRWPLWDTSCSRRPCGAELRPGESRNAGRTLTGSLRGCSYRQHKWQRTQQTFTPAGVRAVLATGKSVGGAFAMVGGVVAGVQVLIVTATFAFH